MSTTFIDVVVAIPGAGSLSATGEIPVFGNQVVEPGAGSLAATGYNVELVNSSDTRIKPDVGSATLAGLAPTIAVTTQMGVSTGTMHAMLGSAGDYPYAASYLPPTGTITGPGSFMAPLESSSTGDLIVPSYAYADSGMAPLVGYATMLTGQIGQVTVTLQPMHGLSGDYPYAGSFLPPEENPDGSAGSYMHPLVGYSYGPYDPLLGYISEFIFLQPSHTPVVTYGVSMHSEVEADATLTGIRVIPADVSDTVEVGVTLDADAIYLLDMYDTIQVQSGLGREEAHVGWVVNTGTLANSMYEGLEFNSMVKWNGRYLAAGDEGIFEMTGSDDNGTPIVASVLFGKTDFNTSELKRVESLYAGVESEGELRATFYTDDGETNYYDMAESERLQTRRAVPGKGLRSRYWEVEITNPDGGDFTIESTELFPAVTKRRI